MNYKDEKKNKDLRFRVYCPSLEGGTSVPRSISKALDIDYSDTINNLKNIALELNIEDYKDEKVFTKYILDNGFESIDIPNEDRLCDIDFSNGTYLAYATDGEYYGLTCIINNIIYDKTPIISFETPLLIFKKK